MADQDSIKTEFEQAKAAVESVKDALEAAHTKIEALEGLCPTGTRAKEKAARAHQKFDILFASCDAVLASIAKSLSKGAEAGSAPASPEPDAAVFPMKDPSGFVN